MYPKPQQGLCPSPNERLAVRRVKAVTIGIALPCSDGIVMCADRQHTVPGSFKYSQGKLLWSISTERSWVMTYSAQDTSSVGLIFDRLRDASTPNSDSHVQGLLKNIFKHDTEELYTLIAYQRIGSAPTLYRTSERKVTKSYSIEYIGIGDCSAMRYLEGVLLGDKAIMRMGASFGVALGTYLVKVANDWVDGCSGGPNAAILNSGVRWFPEKDMKYYLRFGKRFDAAINKRWMQMSGRLSMP
jgi:hypothetical protein